MGKYLNPGNELFDSIIHSEIYVDKTGIIEPLNRWINTEDRFVCVSRARRFGKTVAARTIRAYYDKSCDSRSLFAPFEIAQKPSFEKYLNKFDVIAVDTQTFMQVSQDYRLFVERLEQSVIADLRQNWPDIPGLKDMTLPDALTQIHASTQSQFIFIIDEWDAIFRNHPEDVATQRKWIEFLRDLFKQDNAGDYIALAYLTGILPVKKYKTQSALNQFREYTMIRPKGLAP
ncbi:MAG: AAA family ATPase, partial [Proteobacteria bacterium]|nr:AAA family ATPase [Pseudomonadota bacterium]